MIAPSAVWAGTPRQPHQWRPALVEQHPTHRIVHWQGEPVRHMEEALRIAEERLQQQPKS